MSKTITFKRLNHVHICVPKEKEDEARAFYGGVMGLKEIPKPQSLIANGGMWYEIADIELHIGIEVAMPRSRRHSAFEISDVAEARKFLEDKVQIVEEPVIPGRVRFAFIDPFGNKIELLQMVD